ncbi:Cold-inducible protein YdjO [Paenibacillus sp. 1_12]|uniref:cold-inducible protein YdjO-related protein n=1 Tax=Paenibacillus sp. 1_12 TaxID=1566278 RepID=UPI0008E1BB6F|nr:cold-inducible protein YdjO-related protein [Paenibacillus sp. 1_12]SFL95127.1 Cold-inducible protein YdjO [Paenibacillus sp. 1_12]
MDHSEASKVAGTMKLRNPYLHKFPVRNAESELEQVDIWKCGDSMCTCWMRVGMTFEESPLCPLCQTSMIKSTLHAAPLQKVNM